MTEKRPATGSRGIVVTNHPLGSAAGAEMIAAGGNAVDAAIGALFALTVVEPMMVGIFGAGMTHLRLADGRHLVIDNYTAAPAAARPDMYRPVSDRWPDYLRVDGDVNLVGLLSVGGAWHAQGLGGGSGPLRAPRPRDGDAARDPPRRARLPRHALPGGRAVAFAADGTLEGAACWRADGTPIGVGGGLAGPGTRFRPDASRRAT
jgi:Gamma-glutamyltranspeptidase